MKKPDNTNTILRIIDLRTAFFGLITYALGLGVAHHQGIYLDGLNILLGGAAILFLVEMRNFLSAYYDHPESPYSILLRNDPRIAFLGSVKRQILLQVAMTILTAGAFVTVVLIIRRALDVSAILFIGIAFLVCFFYGAPPFRFNTKGYGELLDSILVANLFPAIGFTLQGVNTHVLLLMLTLPVTLIYLSMKIALSLETYAEELHLQKRSLVGSIGWQKGMTLHTILILAAYLLTGLFMLVDLPWSLVWPILLTLPVGIFQIIQVVQIEEGVKPRWRLLKWTAIITFLLLTYMITISLWIG